jgi:polyhydroxyalkanoate synthesis repressor PhaR
MRELKKYPNRRLYDLDESHYVTVDDVRQMIVAGESIRVLDSKDGSDITRSILLQILAEQEAEGHEPILTNRAIEQIIRFYGQNFGSVVSRYIECPTSTRSISSARQWNERLAIPIAMGSATGGATRETSSPCPSAAGPREDSGNQAIDVGHEARKDQHGATPARRLEAQQRQLAHKKRGFHGRAPLQQLVQPSRRSN